MQHDWLVTCPGIPRLVAGWRRVVPSASPTILERCRSLLTTSTTTTMSLVRAILVAGPSSRLIATRVATPRASLQAARMLSTTPRRCHSSLQDHILKESNPHDNLLNPVKPRSPNSKTASFTAADEPGKNYDPYKDGPGAIDKAVHKFFFTEIVRGRSLVTYS